MKYTEFIKKYNGKKIDYDGTSGVQCVDLAKLYIDKVIGVKPQSIGNAINYYTDFSKTYLKKYFKKIDINSKGKIHYRAGDIVVFKGSSSYGHIAIASGQYSDTWVECYDENFKGSGAGMSLHKELYSDYVPKCILRAKDEYATNINIVAFRLNATITRNTNVYGQYISGKKYDCLIGEVFAGERVKILSEGTINNVIQYYCNNCNSYKIGIIPKSAIIID